MTAEALPVKLNKDKNKDKVQEAFTEVQEQERVPVSVYMGAVCVQGRSCISQQVMVKQTPHSLHGQQCKQCWSHSCFPRARQQNRRYGQF